MSKKGFQVERIAFFSDAVFAIAVTLMILEIKAPHFNANADRNTIIKMLLEMTPAFLATILSFILIGIFWVRHHQLMAFLTDYTTKFLYYNLFFLLVIALIPFSTTLVFENIMIHSRIPLIIYNLNFIIACLLNYLLFSYALNPANNIAVENINEDIPFLKKELLFPLFVYCLVIAISFISIPFASVGYSAFGLEGVVLGKKKS
jgi:uncharacterized membrane protein